jgi:HSP20 family protein
MPNIEVAKPSAKAPAQRPPRDVFDAMRQEMDRLFDRFDLGRWPSLMSGGGAAGGFMSPSIDVKDTGKEIVIEAELPGVTDKDIAVTFADGVLTIKGEKKSQREEKKDDYYLSERSFGSFERSLALPEGVDDAAIEARFEKGVLHVTVPKKPEAVKQQKTIEIKST